MSTQSVLLNCRPLAQKLLLQAQHGLKGAAARPSVAMIAVGGSEKDYGYPHKHARKTAESLGIEWKSRYLANDAAENEVLAAIASLNADSSVTGIVLHRPFPDRLSLKTLQQAVNPEKDVEGMHPSSLGQVRRRSTTTFGSNAYRSFTKAVGECIKGYPPYYGRVQQKPQ